MPLKPEPGIVLSRAPQRKFVEKSQQFLRENAPYLVRKAKGIIYGRWVRKSEISRRLPAFSPNSAGSLDDCGDLAIQAAQQIFPLLSSLMSATSTEVAIVPITSIYPDAAEQSPAVEIAALFNKYGSDKSLIHDYHLLYGPLLNMSRDQPLRILEVGLGSNNPNIVSTMGLDGKPGASLRAFRDFLPRAKIFGADIDKDILFSEERIETFFADQTDVSSLEDLAQRLGHGTFDMVIDDGLHSPNANIATMLLGLSLLKKGGTFIVEDISAAAIPVWKVVARLLPPSFMAKIIQAENGHMFWITMQ